MPHRAKGIQQLKASILINAPVEACYKGWLECQHFPEFMKRVCEFERLTQPVRSPEEVYAEALKLTKGIVPPSEIRHWLFSGPGGKLYEAENHVVLDIPNFFICTTSTDPDDMALQSSVLFSPDRANQATMVEFHISFWNSRDYGKCTQLAMDILESGDTFLEDCLEDFKIYIEKGLSA